MPKPTKCPNPNCKSQGFEAVEQVGNFAKGAIPWLIVQCKSCGYPIGTLNDTVPIATAIRNIEAKLTGSKSL